MRCKLYGKALGGSFCAALLRCRVRNVCGYYWRRRLPSVIWRLYIPCLKTKAICRDTYITSRIGQKICNFHSSITSCWNKPSPDSSFQRKRKETTPHPYCTCGPINTKLVTYRPISHTPLATSLTIWSIPPSSPNYSISRKSHHPTPPAAPGRLPATSPPWPLRCLSSYHCPVA